MLSKIKAIFLSHALDNLYSVIEMQRIIQRERLRSDRTGHKFSLAIFQEMGHSPDKRNAWCLARALLRRSRLTDEIGWFNASQLSAVLPHTAAQGAFTFANDVCKMIADTTSQLAFTVYTYPSGWFQKKGESEQPRSTDIIPGPTAEPFNRPSSCAQSDSQAATLTDIERDAEESEAPFKFVKSMETLFLKPLSWWKRVIDIVGSFVGLVFALPIMIPTAIAVMLTSKGPMFFVQERTGQGYCRFKMYKFRTMVNGAEKERAKVSYLNRMTGPLIKIDRDPRLTKVGSFLRKTSIDELP
jgi:hypothetical protein